MFRDKAVLITGASSGIGFELAKLFAQEGARLVLVSSNAGKLHNASAEIEKQAASKPILIVKDLSDPGAPKKIFNDIQSLSLSIHVLINNAGFGESGRAHALDLDKALQMIDVHEKATVSLTRLFLPQMLSRGSGYIMNVASTAAFQPMPTKSVYAASKAFVLSFTEAVASELAGTGVSATCLCPGLTDTAFFSRGSFKAFKAMARRMMPASAVACRALAAMKARRPLVITGFENRLIVFIERFLPRQWVTGVVKKILEKDES